MAFTQLSIHINYQTRVNQVPPWQPRNVDQPFEAPNPRIPFLAKIDVIRTHTPLFFFFLILACMLPREGQTNHDSPRISRWGRVRDMLLCCRKKNPTLLRIGGREEETTHAVLASPEVGVFPLWFLSFVSFGPILPAHLAIRINCFIICFFFRFLQKNYLVYLKSVVLFTPRSVSDVSVKRGATQRARSLAYLNQNSTSTGLSSLQQERRVKVWIQFCIVYSNQQERLISHGPGLGDPTLSTLNPEASITW